MALKILRSLEEKLQDNASPLKDTIASITIHAPKAVASFLLNQKRSYLISLEKTYPILITVLESDLLPFEFNILYPETFKQGEEKPEESLRKERRKHSDQKTDSLPEDRSSSQTRSSEGGRTNIKRKNRRNHYKNRHENYTESKGEVSLETIQSSPSLSDTSPTPVSAVPTSQDSPYRKKEFSEPSKDHFTVVSESPSQEKDPNITVVSNQTHSLEGASSAFKKKGFRRKTRYPLNTRHRQLKEKEKNKENPPPSPEVVEKSGDTRKGWWQRLLD